MVFRSWDRRRRSLCGFAFSSLAGIFFSTQHGAYATESVTASTASAVEVRSQQARTWLPPSGRPRFASRLPWHGGPVVYAAPTSRGEVNTYPGGTAKPTNPLYSFSLFGTASSLAVDGHANVYLADSFSTWVYEYAPQTSVPLKAYPTQANLSPFNLALRGNDLYVFEAQLEGGIANIAVYSNGATQPSYTLSDPAITSPSGLAVDAAGNVFVGYFGSNFTSGVGEFVRGKMPMKQLDVGDIIPLCLAIDRAGNLLVDAAAAGNTSTLHIFPLGTSTRSIRKIRGLAWLYQMSLTGDGRNIYAADSGLGATTFQLYDYPSGQLVYDYQIGDAFAGVSGIAAWPAARPGVW